MRAGKRSHYQVTFAVLLLGIATYTLLQSMVVPVLPTLIKELHTTQDTATWVMTAYLLSASIATPILGRIGDKVGKERMLVVTLLALTGGSVLAGLSTSIGLMIVARAIQGIGGGVLPLAFGIIRDEFPARKVQGAVGIAAALTAVGGGLGLILAGPIVTGLNYHWLFWIPMIMTAIAAVAAYVLVPESPVRTPGRISWSAAIVLSAWLVALLLAVSEGPSWGWGSARVLGLFGAAVVFAALWILVELKSDAPLIDMRMMRIPTVWTVNLVALLFGIVMYTTMTFLPQLLQTPEKVTGYGFSASITQSGIYMLPMTAGMFILGILSGPLSARFGAKLVLVAGSIVTIVPLVLLALGHDRAWEIYLASSLIGAGVGLAFASMSSLVVQAVRADQTGVASGMNANIRTIGGAVGAGIGASILASGVTARHPFPLNSGYTSTFWFLGAAAVLAAAAAMIIPAALRSGGPTVTEQQAEQDSVPEGEGATAS